MSVFTSYFLFLTCCFLFVTSNLLLLTSYFWLFTYYLLLLICYFLIVTSYLLLLTYYLSLVTYYLLLLTCYFLLVTSYLLLLIFYILLVTSYTRHQYHIKYRKIKLKCHHKNTFQVRQPACFVSNYERISKPERKILFQNRFAIIFDIIGNFCKGRRNQLKI